MAGWMPSGAGGLPGRPGLAGRPGPARAARHPAGRAATGRAAPAVGTRGLAPVQPDLVLRWPGRRRGRGIRLRAGQPDLRGARPGHGPGAGHRVLAGPDRPGPGGRGPDWRGRRRAGAGRSGPGRDRRVPGRLRDGPAAYRGRGRGPARGVPRGARRVRAVGGRVLRRRGQLARPTRTWPTTVTCWVTPPGSPRPTAPPSSTTSAAAPRPPDGARHARRHPLRLPMWISSGGCSRR